jgi:hypothetical protein
MLKGDHHDWVMDAASTLLLGSDILWQAMCAEWIEHRGSRDDTRKIARAVEEALENIPLEPSGTRQKLRPNIVPAMPKTPKKVPTSTEPGRLFEPLPDAPQE